MAFWLTGVAFLFCCENISAASGDAEFCPLAKISSHCDKSAKADAGNSAVSDGDDWVECCEFLPAIFNKARKLEQVQKHSLTAPVELAAPRPRAEAIKHTPPDLAFYPHPAGGQRLFIKNCVFRI
jgi:hypothetical protein